MIPEGWMEVRLGDLGSTFGGLTGKSAKDFGNGDSSFVTFMNVMSNVVLREDGTERVDVKAGEAQAQLRPGDLIFNGSSETPEEVGFAAVVPRELDGVYLNSFCFGFRCNPDVELDPKFFAYLTRSPVGRGVIRPMAQGSTRYNLAKTNLLNGRFLLPSKREQRVIAEALSDADVMTESLDALIAKKRDMKRAAMQQLLSGRTRLPGFTGEWTRARIGEVFAFLKTVALSRAQLNNDSEIGYIHYGDIHSRWGTHLDLQRNAIPCCSALLAGSANLIRDGDLVLADASEDIEGVGRAVEVHNIGRRRVVAGLHTVLLRPDQKRLAQGFIGYVPCLPPFVEQARALAAGLKVYGLSKTSLASITIELPPTSEQRAIAEILSVMDAEINAMVVQREKAEMVKQGMMQELLSGRVRLV